MFGSEKKGKCAMTGIVCPENGDAAKSDYCPHWQDVQETNNLTGQSRSQTQCDIPVMFRWMSDVQQAGWMGAKFLQSLDNARIKQGREPQNHGVVGVPPRSQINGQ
jgi:hypothetical protein